MPSAPSRARSALFAFLQHRCVQRPAHRHNECIAPSIPFANSHVVPTVIVSSSARPQPQPEERKGLVGGPVPVDEAALQCAHRRARRSSGARSRTYWRMHSRRAVCSRSHSAPIGTTESLQTADCCGCAICCMVCCLLRASDRTRPTRNGREMAAKWPRMAAKLNAAARGYSAAPCGRKINHTVSRRSARQFRGCTSTNGSMVWPSTGECSKTVAATPSAPMIRLSLSNLNAATVRQPFSGRDRIESHFRRAQQQTHSPVSTCRRKHRTAATL